MTAAAAPASLWTLPNVLTLARFPLLFVVAGAMLAGAHTVAWVVFVLAALSDWLDGYLARAWGQTSAFGAWMDALTDKVLTGGLFIALLAFGHLPLWTLLVVLLMQAREYAITGLRIVGAQQGVVLASEALGKIKTALQMVAIAVLLLPPALLEWGLANELAVGWSIAGQALFGAAAFLTLWSGLTYAWKYRHLVQPKGT